MAGRLKVHALACSVVQLCLLKLHVVHCHLYTHPEGQIHTSAAPAQGQQGAWVAALSSSLLISLASLVCLALLPLLSGGSLKAPPEWLLQALSSYAIGAMLGDTFLHQIPAAFPQGHGHTLQQQVPGLVVIAGLVTFFLVEKAVRNIANKSSNSTLSHHHSLQGFHSTSHHSSNIEEVNTADATGLAQQHISAEHLRSRRSEPAKDGHVGQDIGSCTAAVMMHASTATQAVVQTDITMSDAMIIGWLSLVTDGIHNFTDGMALASAFVRGGPVLGWSRSLYILAHEIPQEIGDYGILLSSGFKPMQALAWNFASALFALAGTLLVLLLDAHGAAIVGVNNTELVEAFTAGGFIYIAVGGVMPQLATEKGSTLAQLLAIGLGVSSCLAVHMYFMEDHD